MSFWKCCDFCPNSFKFCAVKKNYTNCIPHFNKLVYILYTKSKELCQLNFVYKIYANVCWNVVYILCANILYTFCAQKLVQIWDTFCIQHFVYILYTCCIPGWLLYNVIQEISPFLIFHDAVFPTYPENHDTKTWYKKGQRGFYLINAGWIVSGILCICFYVNQINQLYLSNNEAS